MQAILTKIILGILALFGLVQPKVGGTVTPISPFVFTTPTPRITTVLASSSFQVPSLASKPCIGTDASGTFGSGTCGGGGGSSTRTSTTNFFSFYDSPTTTTGTLNAIDTGSGVLFTSITSTRSFSTNTISINATTTNLSVRNLTSLQTTSIATTSATNIFQVGGFLSIIANSAATVFNGVNPYTYGGVPMAFTVNCNGTYSCFALRGLQPLFKLIGSYNSGDGAELYQDTNGVFRMNVNASVSGFAIWPSGGSRFADRAGSRLSVGKTAPDSGAGKLYVVGEGTGSATWGIYQESTNNVWVFKTSDAGDIFASGTMRLMTRGGTNDGLFYVNTSGNTSVSGTLKVFQTSTLATTTVNNTLNLMVGGSAGQAMCWKTTTTLGYCSSVVGIGGACTCN